MLRHRALELAPEQDAVVKVVDGHVVYVCGTCHRSYMTLSSLKRHSNVHSWRRSYPCRYCDKVFALAEYRTKHEVWHTGERRYQCVFCWDTFVTYYNLKTHQKTSHGINPALISSEKTPNGGYRPKLNALKLYRLLPMRAHKRPYKTYSQEGLPHGFLMPANAVGPALAPPVPPPDPTPVVTYGRPPSVIVHGAAAPGGTHGRAAVVPPIKKQVLKEYIEAQAMAAAAPPPPVPPPPAAPQEAPPGGGTRTMTYVANRRRAPGRWGGCARSRCASAKRPW